MSKTVYFMSKKGQKYLRSKMLKFANNEPSF